MISVITPMYNEASGIKDNITNLLSSLKEFEENWELIIVNDGSKDNSADIVKNTFGDNKNVRLVSYSTNMGRGYALRKGFENAKGDYIITTESDLSWGPDIVGKLFTKLKNSDSDLIIASPYKKGGKMINVPLHRKLLSKWGNKVMTYTVKEDLTMISGMTRAYKRKVIDSLDLESDGKEIHLEIISKAIALGFKVEEIPSVLKWEKSNKGRKSSFNARKFIFSHLLFSVNETPSLLIGTFSLFLFFLGFVGGGLAFYFWLNGTLTQHIFLSVTSIVFLIVGVQSLIFSFLANQNRDRGKEIIRLQRNILEIKKQVLKK